MSALVDYFLNIEGVEGESQDGQYPGFIQLQSWHWAEENAGSWQAGSGGGAGKVQMKDFSFTMATNKASPKLFLMCATGEHVSRAQLLCRKSGGAQQTFLVITFSDLLVSGYRTLGNVPSTHGLQYSTAQEVSVLPTDEITMNFARIEYEYKEQRPDGSMGAVVKSGYDLKLNTRI